MKSSDKSGGSIIEKYNPHFAEAMRGKPSSVYDPSLIESKWQLVWEKDKIYSPNLDKPFDSAQGLRPFYNLMMFPYPSAEGMHVGNMYAFTGADVYGRFQRMQGFSVFEPIGLDGFGIHSENYAIKVGKHPVEQAKISEKNFYRQLRATGNAFDWTRTVETYKPEYYKWTQWLFIQLFKAGLAYRKKAPVNFCPSCKTVLSDEQVITKIKTQKSKLKITTQNSKSEEPVGACERCETSVEKRDLEQWFFRITKYADRLLSNLSRIDWAEKVKIAQKEWIGRSEGTLIRFVILNEVKDLDSSSSTQNDNRVVEVFTTRADTLYGATFLVLAPEHPVVVSLIEGKFEGKFEAPRSLLAKLRSYVEKVKEKTERERGEAKEKTGVFTGLYAINPLNQNKIPIWIADYAIMGYGTGALFGDAHDERDVEFAKKYKIPLKATVITGDKEEDKRIMALEKCFTGYGRLINSGEFSGLTSEEAKKKVTAWLSKNGAGGSKITYHLRDWLISRQRYWGPPIPMIDCPKCGWQPVPDNQLPVELPFIEDYKPLGTGKAPLASHPEFYKTKCPKCWGEAKRETDVSDTFLDSSWYFLRYLATDRDDIPFPMENSKQFRISDFDIRVFAQRARWLPVNMYIGGAEHSVLHLLYSRFITMALHDMGHISFEEPFTKFRAHGLIVKDGAKMSKSKGNVVVPDAYVKKFGADTLRTYLMFMGPYSQGGDFRDSGIEGMHRFLRRVWVLLSAGPVASFPPASARSADAHVRAVGIPSSGATRLQMLHKTIKKVTEDIENLSYNTAIAALMEYYNFLSNQKEVSKEEMEIFLKLLAPFTPHLSEELYQLLSDKKGFSSIHNSSWPMYDEKFLVKDEMIIVIQINGKLRGNVKVQSAKCKVQSYVGDLAKKDVNVARHLEGKEIKKVIYVEGRVLNFVTSV